MRDRETARRLRLLPLLPPLVLAALFVRPIVVEAAKPSPKPKASAKKAADTKAAAGKTSDTKAAAGQNPDKKTDAAGKTVPPNAAGSPTASGADRSGDTSGIFDGAGGKPLTLAGVLASTARLHPIVMQLRQRVARANARVLAAKGAFDPTLVASGSLTPYGDFALGKADVAVRQATTLWGAALLGGWRYGRGDIPVYKLDDKTSAGGQGYLGLEVPLLRGGPIDLARAKLWSRRWLRGKARFEARAVLLWLERAAAQAYWDWVAAGRRLGVDRQLLRIAELRDRQIAIRVLNGALPRIEQLENQRAILKRRGAVIKARRSFEKAAIKLSLYLRDDKGTPVRPGASRLPAKLPRSSMPSRATLMIDLDDSVARRPEVAALLASRRSVDVKRRLASNARLPDLRLSAIASYDFGSEPYESRRTELMFGLRIKFPMLMRKARGRAAAARAKIAEIDAKQRLLRDKVGAQVRNAFSALRAAHQQLEVARRERTVAHRVKQAERVRLQLGSSTLLTVNLREQAAAQADKRVIDATVSYQQALADYNAVTARGFTKKGDG